MRITPDRMTPTLKWGLIVLFWLGWSATCTTFAYSWRLAIGRPTTWIHLAPLYFVAYSFWGPLFTPFTIWMAKRFTIEKTKWFRSVMMHVIAAPAVLVVHGIIITAFDPWIWPELARKQTYLQSLRRNFLASGSDDLFIYSSIVILVHGWLYYQRYRDRELQATLLEAQLAKAQLQALKVQLHPHFLFNTLNSVSELMHQDVSVAERVITRLSDLLRITLENIGTQEVTLRDELEFVKGYLEIEQTRFQDRLKVSLDIAPETLDARVPNLLLQPIVENAIRHGISRRAENGLIQIRTEKKGDQVLVTVDDNGPGLKTSGRSVASNFGIGLSTTRARLDFLYGRNYALELNNRPEGGLQARIVIPYHSSVLLQPQVEKGSLTVHPDVRPMLEGVR
ncbi:MAG TPA: histidine kinase [Terriglobales bacterium]|nr:histidine kinase [Terriglobales bacterium]